MVKWCAIFVASSRINAHYIGAYFGVVVTVEFELIAEKMYKYDGSSEHIGITEVLIIIIDIDLKYDGLVQDSSMEDDFCVGIVDSIDRAQRLEMSAVHDVARFSTSGSYWRGDLNQVTRSR